MADQQLPDLKAKVRLDDSDLDAAVGRAAKKGSAIGSALGSAFGGLAANGIAALGRGLVSAFQGGMEELRGNQTAMAQFDAGLQKSGKTAGVTKDKIQALSDSIEAKTGTDGAAVVSGAALLLTFSKVKDAAGKNNDVFTRATKAGVDLAARGFGSVEGNAVQLGKALNDPIKGIAALSRSGITFSDSQKTMIASMVKSGNVLGAQKIILGEVENQVQGSAEAYGQTLPGKIERAKAALAGIEESAVKLVVPAFLKVVDVVTEDLLPVFARIGGYLKDQLGPVFHTVAEGWRSFAAGLSGKGSLSGFVGTLNSIGLGLRALWQAFQDGDVTSDGLVGKFEQVGAFLHDHVMPVLEQVGGFIKDNLKPILIGLGAAWLLLTAPITGVITGLAILYAKSQTFRDIIASVADFIMTKVVPAAQQFGAFFMGSILPALERVGAFLVTTFTPTFHALSDFFTAHLLPALQGLYERIQANMPAFRAVAIVIGTVIGVVGLLVAKLLGFLLPILLRIAGFLITTWFAILGKLIGIFGAVVRAVAALAPVFMDLIRVAGAIFRSLWQIVKGAVDIIIGLFTGDFGRIKTGITSVMGGVITYFRSVPSLILKALGDVGKLLLHAGEDLIMGFVHGIENKFSAVKGKLGDLTGSLTSWKGPPTRDATLLYGAGQLVIGGFIGGLESRYAHVQRSLGALTDSLAATGSIAVGAAGIASPRAAGTTVAAAPPIQVGAAPVSVRVYLDSDEVAARVDTKVGASAASLLRGSVP